MRGKFVDDALRVGVDSRIDLHLIFAKIPYYMAVVVAERVVGVAQPSVLRHSQSLPLQSKVARQQQPRNMLILSVKHNSFP